MLSLDEPGPVSSKGGILDGGVLNEFVLSWLDCEKSMMLDVVG